MDPSKVTFIDFGLSQKYLTDGDNNHVPQKEVKRLFTN
jgi:hypothetical protein